MLVKTSSTVAAVEAILNDEENGYSSAAIASSMCEQLFDGIQVLRKGIQDEACESLFLWPVRVHFFPVRTFVEGVTYLLLTPLFQQISRDFTSLPGRSMDDCRLPKILATHVHGVGGCCESPNRKAVIHYPAPRTSVHGPVTEHVGSAWRAYYQH